jgi:hypothetical protein
VFVGLNSKIPHPQDEGTGTGFYRVPDDPVMTGGGVGSGTNSATALEVQENTPIQIVATREKRVIMEIASKGLN